MSALGNRFTFGRFQNDFRMMKPPKKGNLQTTRGYFWKKKHLKRSLRGELFRLTKKTRAFLGKKNRVNVSPHPTTHTPGPVFEKVLKGKWRPRWSGLEKLFEQRREPGHRGHFGNVFFGKHNCGGFWEKKHTVSKTQVLFFWGGEVKGANCGLFLGNHLMFSCHYIYFYWFDTPQILIMKQQKTAHGKDLSSRMSQA